VVDVISAETARFENVRMLTKRPANLNSWFGSVGRLVVTALGC